MAHKYTVDVLVNRAGKLAFDYSFGVESIESAVEIADAWRGSGRIFSIQNMDGTVVEIVRT